VRLFVLPLELVCGRAVRERGNAEGTGEDVAYYLHKLFPLLKEAVEHFRVGRLAGRRRNLGRGVQRCVQSA